MWLAERSMFIAMVVLLGAISCAHHAEGPDTQYEKISLEALDRFEAGLELLVEQALSVPRQLDRESVLEWFEVTFGTTLPISQVRAEQLPVAKRRILLQALRNIVFYSESTVFIESFYNLSKPDLSPNVAVPPGLALDEPAGTDTVSAVLPRIVYEELVAHRRFTDAAAVLKKMVGDETVQIPSRFPHLNSQALEEEQIPANSVIQFFFDSGSIHPRLGSIPFRSGTQIIAIAHPRCGPSNRAMRFFDGLSNNEPLLADDIDWVAAPGAFLDFEEIADWNGSGAAVELSIAYRAADWPEDVSFGVTPVFYIFDNGHLKDTIVGWPDDKRYDELIEAVN